MQEIIKVQQNQIGQEEIQTVNARELHAFLENKDHFATWIKDRIEKFGFVENQDFVTYSENTEKGRPRLEYDLSIDMGKELSMVERNEKGKEARIYFLDCEKKAKGGHLPVIHDPQTRALIQLLADNDAIKQEQQRQALQLTHISQQIVAVTPKLTASSLNYIQGSISHAAKVYRQAQSIKHLKISVTEASYHFCTLICDKFKVSDIGYLSDIKPAIKFLQLEAKKFQSEIDGWMQRNSLFTT